jgi:adenine-specific DNA-methyltransferase
MMAQTTKPLVSDESLKGLAERVSLYGLDASRKLDTDQRSKLGQFFTPSSIARFMASLFGDPPDDLRLLDAGAGVGSLTAAVVEGICRQKRKPNSIAVAAYELDPVLVEYLRSTLDECRRLSKICDVEFDFEILGSDFIEAGSTMLEGGLFPVERRSFNWAIINPPYGKIQSKSKHRHLLCRAGIETSNLYSGFLALAAGLLEKGGELVAITPRSFCNGPYFKAFRKFFLGAMTLRRIHVFESREQAFSDDDVLQENIILHAIKGGEPGRVVVSSSRGGDLSIDSTCDEKAPQRGQLAFSDMTIREVGYDQIVNPDDQNLIIHIPTSDMDGLVLNRLGVFNNSLDDLGIAVSTGRVVDFRARGFLRANPGENTVPLIYPVHFKDGFVEWPKPDSKKPNAIVFSADTESLMLPGGNYVLVRRFSSKEEPRRVVTAIYDPNRVGAQHVGFENHLNVYHCNDAGLSSELAKGLAVFLSSTLVDLYFRQFNGHTQVNATDLRMLRYPSKEVLETLGASVGEAFPTQREIDALLEKEIRQMADVQSPNPVSAKRKVEEALGILETLGMPRGQQNERSALTLLALLDLEPETPWSNAGAPLIGITPIMEFCRDHYGKDYAPNTRETVRRQTMHQFVDAGIAVPNPDGPDRPVNSPKFCYQIESTVLALLKTYGTTEWASNLAAYRAEVETLRERYRREREMEMIPVTLSDGQEIHLTPGQHNDLTKAILEEFAPRFAPGGRVIYVGDTGDKWAYFEEQALREMGVTVDVHGKMPDVVIHYVEEDWLLLIEAVTSHGPVDAKRRGELARLFATARPGLVYVTAFLTRSDMARYISEISWETEVWVREAETHLIHFNGERFLGPYDS